MHDSVILTKLFPPANRGGLIPRRGLADQAPGKVAARATLVSAPAGYGKTTLMVQWFGALTADGVRCAWVSLEETERDFVEFFRYLVHALRGHLPEVGEAGLKLIESRSDVDPQLALAPLINELTGLADELFVFLDDFHALDGSAAGEALQFIINHCPPSLHFVIGRRGGTDRSFAALHMRGEMVRVDAGDLRFSHEEATEFLQQIRKLDLTDHQVSTLVQRTEGWIAGLQLASMSLSNCADRDHFVALLSGSERDIADYLAVDVLRQQSDAHREFLLATAVLERMNAGVCEELTGRGDCQEMLDHLERNNIFVAPLDHDRVWFRYHHLFRGFLLDHLRRRGEARYRELCRRASRWFAGGGYIDEAVNYALRAEDYDAATALVGDHASELLHRGQMPRLYSWLKRFPDAVSASRPALMILRCWALFHMNQPDSAAATLHQIEDLIEPADESQQAGDAQRQALVEELKVLRVGVALVRDELDDINRTDFGSVRESLLRPFAMGAYCNMRAYGRIQSSNFSGARKLLDRARRLHESVGASFGVAYSETFAGLMAIARGELHGAMACFQRAEEISIGDRGERSASRAVSRLMQGVVLYEWDRRDESERAVSQYLGLAQECALPEALVLGHLTRARLLAAGGDVGAACAAFAEVADMCRSRGQDRLLLLAENMHLRLLLGVDDLAAAQALLATLGCDLADAGPVPKSWQSRQCLRRLMQARLRLALGDHDGAVVLLEPIAGLSEKAGRNGRRLEALLLTAIAQQRAGRERPARELFGEALLLASRERPLRAFLDEGRPVFELLAMAGADGAESPVPGREVAELVDTLCSYVRADRQGAARGALRTCSGAPSELSERETEILNLIAEGCSNRRIGERLAITENTVKWHVKNIYEKLGVENRTSAVRMLDTITHA